MWGLEGIDYRWLLAIAALLLVPAGLIVLFLSSLQWFGNFDEVVPGQYYRSAQPNAAKLKKYIERHGIRSVLNLRGNNSRHKWYRDEVTITAAHGVQFANFRMSAHKQLTDAQFAELLALLDDLPKPILVHCKSGADRTGLVSAIYAHRIAGLSQAEANRMISFRYGHIGIPFLSEAFAMDKAWKKLAKLPAKGS
jgi:protein tyrosine/serine phosphatase